MRKKANTKKKRLSSQQRSFQKNFLQFTRIGDGIVEWPTHKRLYLKIKPVNTSLMKESEKESLIEELATLINAIDEVKEIALFILDKQADVSTNINLVQEIYENSTNSLLQNYMMEQKKELVDSNAKGAERTFFISLKYSKSALDEEIIRDARQILALDSKFSLEIMKREDIKKVFDIYCTRDFSTEKSVQEHLVEKYQKGDDEDAIAFKNALAPLQAKFMPSHAQIGELQSKTLSIRKYPAKAAKQVLFDGLSKLNGADVTIRLKKIDASVIAAGVNTTLTSAKQTAESSNKETDQLEMDKKQKDLEKLYTRMLNNNENMYQLSIFINVKAETFEEMNLIEKRVQKELQIVQFIKETPKLLQKEAWYSCAPFGENQMEKLVQRNVPLSTAACLMPFVYSGRKDPLGQIIGEDQAGGKMLVDFEKKDQQVANTNICILGESGQGKSRLEHMIMFQKVARGNRLFIEDPEREHNSFVEKLGGTYIQPGGEYMINPLEIFNYGAADEEEDQSLYFSQVSPLRQHIGWLVDFFREYNEEINADIVSILLEKFYISHGYSAVTNTVKSSEETPILSDFYKFVELEVKLLQKESMTLQTLKNSISNQEQLEEVLANIENKELKPYKTEELETFLQQIYGICVGSDSDLCNGKTYMVSNKVVAWDLNDLLAGSKKRLRIVQHIIAGYVWNQVVVNRYGDKVTYVISELSLRLNKDNMNSIVTTVAMLKRFRKYEADMILSTQNPYDMLRDGLREFTAPLFTSPSFRFLFYPGDGNAEQFIRTVNITETEYSKISKSKRGNALFTAGATKYHVQISAPTPTENIVYGKGGGQ